MGRDPDGRRGALRTPIAGSVNVYKELSSAPEHPMAVGRRSSLRGPGQRQSASREGQRVHGCRQGSVSSQDLCRRSQGQARVAQ